MSFVEIVSEFHNDESGQDLIEYVLVVAAVALAAIGGSGTLSSALANAVNTLNARIQNCLAPSATTC